MRAQFSQSSLADLYDQPTMSPKLVKAQLAVEAAFGKRGSRNEAERVALLFEHYQAITSLLPVSRKPGRTRAAKHVTEPPAD